MKFKLNIKRVYKRAQLAHNRRKVLANMPECAIAILDMFGQRADPWSGRRQVEHGKLVMQYFPGIFTKGAGCILPRIDILWDGIHVARISDPFQVDGPWKHQHNEVATLEWVDAIASLYSCVPQPIEPKPEWAARQ